MGHEVQDQVSLELGKRVAAGLAKHPEWLELARANLDRWSRQNHDAPALLRCYDELTETSGEGQRLRQNSPFAGVLSPKEVWEIKSRLRRHATNAA